VLKYIVQITETNDDIWFLFQDEDELDITSDRKQATRFSFKEAYDAAEYHRKYDGCLQTKMVTIIEAE